MCVAPRYSTLKSPPAVICLLSYCDNANDGKKIEMLHKKEARVGSFHLFRLLLHFRKKSKSRQARRRCSEQIIHSRSQASATCEIRGWRGEYCWAILALPVLASAAGNAAGSHDRSGKSNSSTNNYHRMARSVIAIVTRQARRPAIYI